MNRVPCPHCGFMNFSISAYCGRCERPLPRANEAAAPTPVLLGTVRSEPTESAAPSSVLATVPPEPTGSVPAAPRSVHATVPPEPTGSVPAAPRSPLATVPPEPGSPAARSVHATVPPEPGSVPAAPRAGAVGAPRPRSTEAPTPIDPLPPVRPPSLAPLTPIPLSSFSPPTPPPLAAASGPAPARTPASPLASVPPPLPPLSLDTPPPAVQPIELEAAGRERKRPAGPDVGAHPDPDAEIPVTVPGGLRLLAARAIDGTVILTYGAAVVFLGMLVTGATFATPSSGVLDTIAEWLSLNRELVEGSIGMTAGFGIAYGVWSAARSGQTLGRKLTNTVLVRRDGKPFTAWRLLVRAVASLVSAALLGAGFLWAILDPYHRTWHDLVAGTVTVRRYVHVPGERSA